MYFIMFHSGKSQKKKLLSYFGLIDRKTRTYAIEKAPIERISTHCGLGNIHVLRNHKGGREGVSQMLTFPYRGGTVRQGS